MDIIFFGSSDFSINSLSALHKSGHNIKAVVTQPDKQKGRGLKIASPPCAIFAKEEGLPLYQPGNISSREAADFLKTAGAELFVVVSYGRILSRAILEIPELYSINLHTSILPEYRGAAPIEWAIINGETETGVTIFRLEEKLDSGSILLQKKIPIEKDEDAVSLAGRMAVIGADTLIKAVALIDEGKAEFSAQDECRASLAPKIKSSHKHINWDSSVESLHNLIRGLTTEGGAFTFINGKRLKVWKSRIVSCGRPAAKPGTILDISHMNSVEVAANDGVLTLSEVQVEGGRRMGAYDFTLGHSVSAGIVLG